MRFKKFTAVILIIMLLMIPIKQAEAIAPAIGPAIYYGVASLLVASGVYAATDEDLQYLVNDYWNRTSDNIKYRWNQAKLYAGVAGYLLIDKGIMNDMTDYLINEKGITAGDNIVLENPETYSPITINVFQTYNTIYLNGMSFTLSGPIDSIERIGGRDLYLRSYPIKLGGYLIFDGGFGGYNAPSAFEHYITNLEIRINSNGSIDIKRYWYNVPGVIRETINNISYSDLVAILGTSVFDWLYGEGIEFTYVGDAAGIGHELQPEQELKVPVPPVLEKDFPDLWTDLNLERNPHLSAENQKRVLDELLGGDWYYDAENDWWYQVKKDDPPKKPSDEKKPFPILPLPMPFPDTNTPTADAPDITTTTGPETTVTTQNQDGTTTETTTQDITETKTWYDTETGWNTETSTRTKTTTTVRDQDGTELSRDVVMGPPTGTTTTQETPKRDDDRINWDPLKLPILGLTMKFPFSLPWDLMRGLESLQSDSEWDRKFIIAVGDDLWPEMEIDLSMFDNIAQIVKVILLILFDFGLIFSTRRLMGGDV